MDVSDGKDRDEARMEARIINAVQQRTKNCGMIEIVDTVDVIVDIQCVANTCDVTQ